mgnify:FL=1
MDGGVEYAYRYKIDENKVWKWMIGLLVHWQSETLEEVKKCSFQCDRVEYDWEKGMTFGVG